VEAEIRIVDYALLGGSILLPDEGTATQDVAGEAKGTLSVMRQFAALLLEEVPADGR
jgi:hypothetical protein